MTLVQICYLLCVFGLCPRAEAQVSIPAPATLEEQWGCDNTNDVTTGKDICSLYAQAEKFYGRYQLQTPGQRGNSINSDEPDSCRYFFTTFVRARNVINCYKQEAQALANTLSAAGLKKQGLGAAPAANQVQNLDSAAKNYKAMTALHQKYLTQLTKQQQDLEAASRQYANMPGFGAALLGGAQESTSGRDRLAQYILNTEKNCKGGSLSNVPALWWVGVNKKMVDVFKKVQPTITQAVANARKLASDGVSSFGGLETATYGAANKLNAAGLPSAPSSLQFADGNPDESDFRSIPQESAIAAGLDRSIGLLEKLEIVPGATKLVGILAAVGLEGLRTGIRGALDPNNLIVAGISCFGLAPAVLAAAIGTVVSNDQERTTAYVQYALKNLRSQNNLSPQQLSQGFCQWLKNHNEKASPRSAPKAGVPGTPGSPGNTD